MQIVDNLVVLHDIEQKETQLFDVKLPDFQIPLMVDHTKVDESLITQQNMYFSDLIFAEEKE